MAGIKLKGNTSGEIVVQSPDVAGANTLTLPASTGTVALQSSLGTRNLIINGDMRIDQRNAGASVTQNTSVSYTVDRWSCYGSVASKFTVQQNVEAVTPPSGFTNYLGITSSSAYTVGASEFFFVQQAIEGYNIANLGWGTSNAQTVTLSFYVRSSLTGTFGGTLSNGTTNRVYPFTYTISSANTWEQKTVTITGDTTGTWSIDNTGGLVANFNMGAGASVSGSAGAWSGSTLRAPTGATSVVGTSGATFYITGVQLEAGESATEFEHRPFDMELQRCKRYFYKIDGGLPVPSNTAIGAGFNISTTSGRIAIQNPVEMRDIPTFSYTGEILLLNNIGNGIVITSLSASFANTVTAMLNFNVSSGMSSGNGTLAVTQNGTGNSFQADAEL